jgi:hypothetical protein
MILLNWKMQKKHYKKLFFCLFICQTTSKEFEDLGKECSYSGLLEQAKPCLLKL